jgi:hypothetical protein
VLPRWAALDNPGKSVHFIRASGALPLPTPVPDGSISKLREFLNIESEEQWCLIVAWLIGCFMPAGPHPVLMLQGEQGTAKSTTARLLRALVDPRKPPLRGMPKDPRDFSIAARNSWLLIFDNISSLPAWLADCLCTLSTGGRLRCQDALRR